MLPEGFVNDISSRLADGEADSFFKALDEVPPTSVRINHMKVEGVGYEVVRGVQWCEQGFYLRERPLFTLDPVFHGGGYYVQEASSMIVGELVRRIGGKRVLDLCAAPGGKTTHLASVVGVGGVVVANEVIKSRAVILEENVTKWGLGNVVVTNSDAARFGALAGVFDVLVVDAPCSGEGMFRKDFGAREQWTQDGVKLCASRARRIVSDAWNCLQEGGVLIYSTCTFNEAENEDNVRWICSELGADVERIEWPAGVEDTGWGGRFWPHKVDGEGFFCAVLRKTGGCDYSFVAKRGRRLGVVGKGEVSELNSWVREPLEYGLGGKSVYGYREGLLEVVEVFLGSLNVLTSGVQMGEMIRGELKPSQGLAMYYDLKGREVSEIGVLDALEYLRRGIVDVDIYVEGLSLVKCGGLGLGWAKRIGGRVNNGYPQGWRIRLL